MPIYTYQNPKTKQEFDVRRSFADSDTTFYDADGTICPRVLFPSNNKLGIVDKNAEVFEKDPDYCKSVNPKYVKYLDGHREKYDPTRHC